jgi:hypothetical protein
MITMRKIKDVLRLHFSAGLSIRQIHRSTKISVGSIQSLLICDRYLNWVKKQRRSMRQHHKAGDILFVDYAGQTMLIIIR